MSTKQKLVWHTEKMKVADLIPNDKNPRTLSDQQKEDLMKSLEKFNLVEIPVIDIDKKLLAGHQRALSLSLLGRSGEIIDVRVPNRKINYIILNFSNNSGLFIWACASSLATIFLSYSPFKLWSKLSIPSLELVSITVLI